jgi:hypothetical protein
MRTDAHARYQQENLTKRRNMKETTNIKIDMKLKELFTSTKGFHNMTIGDACEFGIREILTRSNHVEFIDQEIQRKQAEISRMASEIGKLTELKEHMQDLQSSTIFERNRNGGERDTELEQIRNEKFEKSREGIIKLWKRADINWDSVIINFRFSNKKEAQEWFRDKIEAHQMV